MPSSRITEQPLDVKTVFMTEQTFRRILFFALLLFIVAGHVIWLQLGGHPLDETSAEHLAKSITVHRIGEDTTASFVKCLLTASDEPPLLSYVSALFHSAFGESEFSASLAMLFFFLILVIAVYRIGAVLYAKNVGLLAALIASCLPIAFQSSRIFSSELPLAAMAALSFLLVLRTDRFSRKGMSVLLGIIMGCGMLANWIFPALIVTPFILELARALRWYDDAGRRLWNAFLSILVAVIITAPWYLAHSFEFLFLRSSNNENSGHGVWENIFLWLTSIPEQTGWILVVALLIGIILYAREIGLRQFIVVWCFLGGFIAVSFWEMAGKGTSIFLLVPVTLIACAGFISGVYRRIHSPVLQRSLFVVFCMLPIIQYYAGSFLPPSLWMGKSLSASAFSSPLFIVDAPKKEDWQLDSILVIIEQDHSKNDGDQTRVGVVSNHTYFNGSTLSLTALIRRDSITFGEVANPTIVYDYYVVKADHGGLEDKMSVQANRIFSDIFFFQQMAAFPLPDSSHALLFRTRTSWSNKIPTNFPTSRIEVLADSFLRQFIQPVKGYTLSIDGTPDQLRQGIVGRLLLKAKEMTMGHSSVDSVGLMLRNVELDVRNIHPNMKALLQDTVLEIKRLGSIKINKLTMTADDLKRYLNALPNTSVLIDSLSIDDGKVFALGRSSEIGPQVSLTIAVDTNGGKSLGFIFEEARLGRIPLPSSLLTFMTMSVNPMPFRLEGIGDIALERLRLENNRLQIGRLEIPQRRKTARRLQ